MNKAVTINPVDPFEPDPVQAGAPIEAPILVQYWTMIKRWKWVIAGVIVVALALGVIATLLATPQYTATARIEISREQQNVTKVEGLESPQASRDEEFYQTQYANLQARSLAERVARHLRLARNPAFFEAHGVSVGEEGLTGAMAQPRNRAELAER